MRICHRLGQCPEKNTAKTSQSGKSQTVAIPHEKRNPPGAPLPHDLDGFDEHRHLLPGSAVGTGPRPRERGQVEVATQRPKFLRP